MKTNKSNFNAECHADQANESRIYWAEWKVITIISVAMILRMVFL